MQAIDGRKRVVIHHVQPEVYGGVYPAKAISGQPIPISADAFCDGHDALYVWVSIRYNGAKQALDYPLQFLNNDRWRYVYTPEKTGKYQFQVWGIVDHWKTWSLGLSKKIDAGQDISVDLSVGTTLIDAAIARAGKKDRTQLEQWKEQLSRASVRDLPGLLDHAALTILMRSNMDLSLASSYKQLTLDVHAPKAAFSTWYELFPRSASTVTGRHGTFRDVQNLLPRIAAMGFDVLYLPPIHPIGIRHRKGKNNALSPGPDDPGSPWAIGNATGGHKSIHPELGTLKDFRALVKAAKSYAIDIAMDIAFQCSPDHPYVTEHPEWFSWRPDGTVQYAENPPKKYEDILPFNFESADWKALWLELKSVVMYWIEQGISVFRVDNPHTKPFAFWEWLIRQVREEHPDTIFLAEAFTRPRLMERLAMAGFTQSYTYFSWRNTAAELRTYMEELTCTDMRYYFQPNFWPNTPDILPPFLSDGGMHAHWIRLLLAATLSSSYGVYGPVFELGEHEPMPGKEEYNNNEKYELRHWDWACYTKTKELMARVNLIRRQHSALQQTANIRFGASDNNQLLCYVKTDPVKEDILIMIVNLDPHYRQSGTVTLPDLKAIDTTRPYRVTDLLSGDSYTWQGLQQYIILTPHDMPAHIFSVNQIQ